MLPAIIAAIGLAASIGTSIYANKKSAEANKEMQKTANDAYNQQNAEAEQLKASEGDFLNTALGKQMIENLKRQYSDAVRRDVSGGLKQGNTDEQKLAAKSNLDDAYAKNLAHIASVGTQYRSHVLNSSQQLKNEARNRKYGADMARLDADNQSALNIADNGQKIGNGLMNVAGAFGNTNSDTSLLPSAIDPKLKAGNQTESDFFLPNDFLRKQKETQFFISPEFQHRGV
jgi:hypothetical protein